MCPGGGACSTDRPTCVSGRVGGAGQLWAARWAGHPGSGQAPALLLLLGSWLCGSRLLELTGFVSSKNGDVAMHFAILNTYQKFERSSPKLSNVSPYSW